MRKSERKVNLIHILRNQRSPIKIEILADNLECSMKTIRRDVEELVVERLAPWFISDGKVYVDRHRQQIELDGYWFTSEELFALLALYQTIDGLSEGIISSQFKDAKRRILQMLGAQKESLLLIQNVKIIPLASPIIQNQFLNKMAKALAQQKRVHIEFWNRHLNEKSQREISPLQLVRYRDHWLIDAYCHQKNALRSFSLEAILKITYTDLDIQKIDQMVLENYFKSSYGIFSGQADKVAILQFTAYQARWIKDQVWHPKQHAKWLKDGRYELHLPYKEDIELIQDILKYGSEVEVISPPELRQKIQDKLQKAYLKYLM